MPKKTLRRPCRVPPQRLCSECGKDVKRRDIAAGRAEQVDDDKFICTYCVSSKEQAPLGEDSEASGMRILEEIKDARQIQGEPFRRWFTNGDVDLIVWSEENRIVGFQLIVPSDDDIHTAITWRKGKALSVAGVDDGEGRAARHKMTPLLTYRRDLHAEAVLSLFRPLSVKLPSGVAALVEEKICEASGGGRGRTAAM